MATEEAVNDRCDCCGGLYENCDCHFVTVDDSDPSVGYFFTDVVCTTHKNKAPVTYEQDISSEEDVPF